MIQTRRGFLTTASVAGLLGVPPVLADEGPPETTTVRLSKFPGICVAPQYMADDLLRAEGFSDARYVEMGWVTSRALADGHVDVSLEFPADLLQLMDAARPVMVLAGVHAGCLELFVHGNIRNVADLKGKTVGLPVLGVGEYLFMTSIAGYVGLDPLTEITWVGPTAEVNPMKLFIEGKIDAYFTGPPETQELRARNVGHVVLRTAVDRPWSQYFCCMLTANADFVRNNPVATKRVVRALMKATDLCLAQPEWAARRLVDEGFTDRYEYAIETLNEVRYGAWREYDPEDTLRFYALRLHELGMINSTPNELIKGFTDWRFLNEVKRELKA
jgi:NitT/TauT family transport system substrate-binding protein